VQRDNPQREVKQIAGEPEAVSHVPEVQLPEPEVNVPPIAPAHTNTIGVQTDNNVINGEDFISENTPLIMTH
jgi:ABC-type phosphate transport system auxiliary subunit